MSQNFDCTQFITFEYNGTEDIYNIIEETFCDLEFVLLKRDQIRSVKRHFFSNELQHYFIELKNDNFMGEFEDWKHKEEPPILIVEFVNKLTEILSNTNIDNAKLMLTFFAEENATTKLITQSDINNVLESLYLMSKHNFDVWVDNLVIEFF